MENKIKSFQLQGDLDQTFLSIVIKGLVNEGANPPESFQLFVNGYLPFWNDVDTGCDTISWQWFSRKNPEFYLTTTLRKRMKQIVLDLNSQLKQSALRLANEVVFYIDGFENSYVGHQFCQPGTDLRNPNSPDTWFWHDSR
jgi:hypothetical protein